MQTTYTNRHGNRHMAKLHPQINAKKIVRKFNGTAELHRMLMRYGYRNITRAAVQKWSDRGQIGGMWVPILLDMARHEGIDLDPREFLEGGEHPNELIL